MKVTLARVPDYAAAELQGASPDDTVDVPDALANRLVDDGHARWPAEDAVEDPQAGFEEFDPSAHTVDQVTDYLKTADELERERVLAAEAAGQARKGIANWQPAA